MPADDRTTILGHAYNEGFKTKVGSLCSDAVTHLNPADKLAVIAKCAAEVLVEEGCPSADAERAYAILSLMADVWNPVRTCTIVSLSTAPKTPTLTFEEEETIQQLFERLQEAKGKPVRLKLATPAPKP